MSGETLRALRKRAGLTQEALARRFGCHRYTLIRYEQGRRRIPEDWCEQLLATLEAALAERMARHAAVAGRLLPAA